MDEEKLKRLESSLHVTRSTLDIAFRRFEEQSRAAKEPAAGQTLHQDVDAFLGYLHAEGVIGTDAYRSVSATEPVAVSAAAREVLESDGPQYEVFEKIAEGGMGEIRVARDRRLRHLVAIKVLKSGRNSGPAIDRFVTEAQVTAQLDHPNIVPVYGLHAEADGELSFSMKMVDGKTLRDLVREAAEAHQRGEPLDTEHSLTTRLEHFLKLCDAMSYAHSKGVLHRDLKPTNVMVGAHHEVYLMDWGVARIMGSAADEPSADLEISRAKDASFERTTAEQLIGTPAYMSPEQARGEHEELDERSDLYCLGLVLFELVTLRRAVEGKSLDEVLHKAAKGRLAEVKHAFPRVPIAAELAAVIRKAAAPSRDDRYRNVDELADDLRRFLNGDEVQARPDNPAQKLLRWMGRHRQLTLLFLASALLVAAAAIIWSLRSQKLASERARVREDRLTRFQSQVAMQAHLVDRQFLRLEEMLAHLAEKAVYLMRADEPWRGQLYSNDDFATASRAPPDLRQFSVYASKAVSLGHPVYVLAPGVELAEVEPALRRLAPIGEHYLWMLLQSHTAASVPRAQAALERLLEDGGVPIRWVYIGLANGVMFSYPGKAGYPDGYDPRKRPWYALGADRRAPVWGNPYIDLQGQGLVLPGALGIYDDGDHFYGVAGLEVTFDYIIRSFLLPTGDDPREERFLLDERGRIVVRSSQLDKHYSGGTLHDALELETFPVPEVVRAVRAREAGQLETHLAGARVLIGYHGIPSLGWHYAVVAGRDHVLAPSPPVTPPAAEE